MNTELIIKVMERVTDENLNMQYWARSLHNPLTDCGTTMCLAGHTVVAAGHAVDWQWEPGPRHYEAVHTVQGLAIDDLAQELLGLTDDQAVELFYATDATTVDELWEAVTRITGVKRPVPVPA